MGELLTNVRVESDGGVGPGSTQVFVNGVPVKRVRNVSWNHDAGTVPTLDVELLCAPIEIVGADIRYHGLEDVPVEALRQELERREQEDE